MSSAPQLLSSLPSSSLLPHLTLKPLSTNLYAATFPPEFCIGSVPHGGYISSAFLSVASKHFGTTLRAQSQPDTIILSLQFLRRTSAGPALFRVRNVKLGRQTSVIHISLLQGNIDEGWDSQGENAEKEATEEAVAYITNTNISTESGPSHETGWQILPPPPPASFSPTTTTTKSTKPSPGPGANWKQVTTLPFASFRKATSHVELWMPSDNQQPHPSSSSLSSTETPPPGRVDQWVRMRTGEPWTNLHLGYLADYFPRLIGFMEPPPPSSSSSSSTPPPAKNWYPTLSLTLEIKTPLPAEGVEWVFVSAQMRSVVRGRSDIALVILDAQGTMLASSNHSCLVVPVERNTGKRAKVRVGGGESGGLGKSGSKI